MNHVQIKWKSVTFFLAIIVVIIVIYYYIYWGAAPNEICNEEVDWSELGDSRDLDYYCNHPNLPVSGSEGVSGSDDLRLVSVQVVIRHGDRSPLHSVPNVVNKPLNCQLDPSHSTENANLTEFLSKMERLGDRRHGDGSYAGYKLYPTGDVCGLGCLTETGVQQHILNGAFLRHVYITKHKLFDTDDDSLGEQVLVRGTVASRTFQSAVAFMHGFAPQVDMSRLSAVEMADNNTLCTSRTGHQCACTAVQSGFLSTFSVTFGQRSSSIRDRPAVQRIATRLSISVSELPRLSNIFDVTMTHFCHGLAVSCLGALFVRDVFDVIGEAGHLAMSSVHYQHLARLKLQPLLYEIAHRMKRQLQDTVSLPKLVLYSGHDSTIEPLVAAIGVSNGMWPRYASRLVFELYAPKKEAASGTDSSIRVLYNGKDVTRQLSFCRDSIKSGVDASLCPLDAFLDFVNDSKYSGSPGETGYNEACMDLIS